MELKNRFDRLKEEEEPNEELNLGNILGLGTTEKKGKEEFKEEEGWKKVKDKKVLKIGSGNGGIPAVPKAHEGMKDRKRRKKRK